jgi:hypothetical protein
VGVQERACHGFERARSQVWLHWLSREVMEPPVARAWSAAWTPAKLSGRKGEAQCQAEISGWDRTSARSDSHRRQRIFGMPVDPEERTPRQVPAGG